MFLYIFLVELYGFYFQQSKTEIVAMSEITILVSFDTYWPVTYDIW